MKLAYSTLACPNWTVEQATEAAVTYGYDAIEWRLADGEILSAKTPAEVKARVVNSTRQHNLAVACLDTGCQFVQADDVAREAVVNEAMTMVDLAVELGAPYVRVFGGQIPANLTRTEILQPTAAALARAAQYANDHGVKILLETHDDWAHSPDAVALARYYQEEIGEACPLILWDVHHPFRMDETPEQTLHNLADGKLIAHVHVKDALRNAEDREKWQLTLLGGGELPLKEIIGLLQRNGYEGYLSLEWEKKWHSEIEEPEVALPQAAQLLRQYLSGD